MDIKPQWIPQKGSRVIVNGPSRWKINGKSGTVVGYGRSGIYNYHRTGVLIDGEKRTSYLATKWLTQATPGPTEEINHE